MKFFILYIEYFIRDATVPLGKTGNGEDEPVLTGRSTTYLQQKSSYRHYIKFEDLHRSCAKRDSQTIKDSFLWGPVLNHVPAKLTFLS